MTYETINDAVSMPGKDTPLKEKDAMTSAYRMEKDNK